MRRQPRGDPSDRLLTIGVFLSLIGALVAVAGYHVAPRTVVHATAWALGASGGLAMLVGVLITWLDLEGQRQRRHITVGRFYQQQVARWWRSLSPLARVTYGVVVPVAAATISALAWMGAPTKVVALVWTSSMLVLVVLLTVAGRNRAR
jgi:hypothetical protein